MCWNALAFYCKIKKKKRYIKTAMSPPRAWMFEIQMVLETVSWICLALSFNQSSGLRQRHGNSFPLAFCGFWGCSRQLRSHTPPSKGILKYWVRCKHPNLKQGEQASSCLLSWHWKDSSPLVGIMRGRGHWFPSWILHLSTCSFYIL